MPHEILIVEDSRTQAESLRILLDEHGYDVTVARSAEEAMALLPDRHFDLVLSDVMMPGADGYALARFIKALERPELGVILLTTLGDPLDIVRGLAAGADNYVTKPYDPNVLLARVQHVLAGREHRGTRKATLGVEVEFLGVKFTVTSEKEQILDLLLSSVEDTVRVNRALQESQRSLADAHEQLREHAERMRRQAQLSTGRYEALMQHAWDAIFVVDAHGRILETNERATRLLAELGGPPAADRRLSSLVAPSDGARLDEALRRLPDDGHVDVRDVSVGGEGLPCVYWDLSLTVAPGDHQDLVLAIAHDITERRGAERRLRESEERARVILDSLTEGVVLVRSDGTLEWYNRCAAELLGAPTERVPGRSTGELGVRLFDAMGAPVPPREYPSAIALRDGHAPTRVLRLAVDGHAPRWVFASAHALPRRGDSSADGAVTSFTDITEWKRIEEQLHQSRRLEAVGRLAGGVAHDFNNILSVIKSYSEVALASLEAGSELHSDIVEINRAADRAAALTRQLLTFGRRRLALPQPHSLNDVVSHLETMLRRVIREDTGLSISLDESLPIVVADSGQLEQVLLNLVVNARDAMPDDGHIAIETRTVRLDDAAVVGAEHIPAGSYAVLAVSDTGVGIPPEVRDRIFEPFFTTKEQGKGTGLGLATVYGIVKDAGGHITVYSEPGRGTTFKIYLPLTDALPVAPSSAVATPTRGGSGETILVSEDEDAVRRVVCQELRRLGYRVLEARTGDKALAIATEHREPIHALITDMIMPGMNGRDLAVAARAFHPELRVLYTSGYSAEIISREDLLQPGFAFLEKPFSITDLARRVRAVLDDGTAGADALPPTSKT